MWSGDTQSQGGSYPTQWALNPTAYVNIPSEQVDWATLAQQWIKMKEGLPVNEKDKDEILVEVPKEDPAVNNISVAAPTWSSTPPLDGVWPNNWGWDQGGGWCWTGDTKVGSGGQSVGGPTGATPTPPFTPSYQSEPPVPAPLPLPSHHYSTTQAPTNSQPYSSNQGYWTADPTVKDPNWDASSHRPRKPSSASEPLPELDSAKRKQLPAWIREGLEKMEREKQKKAESERLEKQRSEALARQKEEDEKQEQISELNGSPAIPKKSKFETDSEDSGEEKIIATQNDKVPEKSRRSRFDWRGPEPVMPLKPIFKTKEEILQHVMAEVRKILTHLLMEVTTEEMLAIAGEVHGQFQRKAPASTVRKTSALASLTGKLGLGIYDSDSGSDISENEGAANGADSDQELRDRIIRRKEDFMDTERRIEKEIAEQEEKERKVLLGIKSVSREASPDTEEQVQPTQQGAVSDTKTDRRVSKDSTDIKTDDYRESKIDNKTAIVNRDRHETKRASEKVEVKRGERKARKHSSVSSSSSSRSSSPYRRRKHTRHKREKHGRRSRSKSRSRSRSWSRERSRERKHRRKERRYRSRSSSRRRRSGDRKNRHRSSSSSSSGFYSKKSSHRR